MIGEEKYIIIKLVNMLCAMNLDPRGGEGAYKYARNIRLWMAIEDLKKNIK